MMLLFDVDKEGSRLEPEPVASTFCFGSFCKMSEYGFCVCVLFTSVQHSFEDSEVTVAV